MKSTAANGGLRRLLFAGGLAATGVAALLSPDWSAVLKAQGYYGNVDLGISISGPERLMLGEEAVFLVRVRNQGPDTAHRVRTIATSPQLNYFYGSGCLGPSYPQCALADSLEAGTSAAYLLRFRVPADAQGHVQFSASVASDDTETQPGDEIRMLKVPVFAQVDLRSEIDCARPSLMQDSTAHCRVRFYNDGDRSSRLPQLRARVNAAAQSSLSWSCQSDLPSQCTGAAISGDTYSVTPELMVGRTSVTFFVELQLSGAPPVITLEAAAQLNPAMNETDLFFSNNYSTLQFEPSLFAHDFEPAG